eukprot:m.46238 g.46238  ORF g.46238 m.46238 type:complete len:195 (+) comp11093_c0_seq2:41-625(+)
MAATFECFLLGVIADPSPLFDRAKAECLQPNSFKYYERAFSHPRGTKTKGPVTLRVRQHSDNTLQLLHQGSPSGPASEPTLRRSVTTTTVSPNYADLLASLNFTLAFELVREGTSFTFRNGMELTISRIYSLSRPGDLTTTTLVNEHFYAEVSAHAPQQRLAEVQKELKTFAQTFQPHILFTRDLAAPPPARVA